MAGSYSHIVNDKNDFIGTELLDNLGDAYEALEECWYMINFLAGGDKKKVFEAHRKYVALSNPEYAKKMTAKQFFAKVEEDDPDMEPLHVEVEFKEVEWKRGVGV
ncbi:MAG: hypothetical protein HC902_07600 [Calothrix sp. SM1_5_4]|nr:hypothetical protein [Calothrix sp. SM1_5_4]